jgi:uncharacterized protein (TIGR02118 family)
MIKGIAVITKKQGLSDKDFHAHWRDVHGPLGLQIKAFRRYVQSHRITQPVPGFENCPYDGAAEFWFDDLATMLDMPNNPDYINGALADEPNLVDPAALRFLTTTEHVFIEGPKIEKNTPLVKAIFLLHRLPGMSVAEFQDYWINGHAPQIPRDAGIMRYVQCHQVPETYAGTTPAYDGVAELSFADYDAFEAYWTSERTQAIFAADAPKFLDTPNCTAFLAEETRMLWP